MQNILVLLITDICVFIAAAASFSFCYLSLSSIRRNFLLIIISPHSISRHTSRSSVFHPLLTHFKSSVHFVPSAASSPTFLANHKYSYGVEGVVSVYLTGADKQETGVKLQGQVTVSALGNCAHVLKIQNLVISGPDGKVRHRYKISLLILYNSMVRRWF